MADPDLQMVKWNLPEVPPIRGAHPAGLRGAETMAIVKEFARARQIILDRPEVPPPAPVSSSSAWTGRVGRAERLIVLQDLLPQAQTCVATLIESYARIGHNDGPALNDIDPVAELRALHDALGQLIAEVDAGLFNDELGEGVAADAVRYAKNFASAVSYDPIPYAISTAILTIFSVCNLPTAAGFLAMLAISVSARSDKHG